MLKQPSLFQIATQLGPVIVLLLLCSFFSLVNWQQQHPNAPADGTELAQVIVAAEGNEIRVQILAGQGEENRQFVDAIHAELGVLGLADVTAFTGNPRQIREFLDGSTGERATGDASRQTIIATNHRAGSLKFLAEPVLRERGGLYADAAVYMPASYTWPVFLTVDNLRNLFNNSAQVAIVAVGMTLVIITAGIDLSVGSVMALAAVMTAVSINTWFGGDNASGWGVLGGCCVGMGVGAACGAFNGAVSTFLRVPPFIVTLAMFMIARGMAYEVATGYGHTGADGSTVATPEAVTIGAEAFRYLSLGRPLGIPVPILIVFGLYIVTHLAMTKTSFGRYVYAVGGNREAARLSGVPVSAILIVVYALCGAAAGLSGIIDASRFGGRPAAGELYELQAIAAVVVGGTSIAGGEGRVTGTLVGTLIIAVIDSGLSQLNMGTYQRQVVFGGLILVTVVLDQLKHRYASVNT